MRSHGNLVRWNDDRGFGFITPAQGTDEIFVHISQFPRDGVFATVLATLALAAIGFYAYSTIDGQDSSTSNQQTAIARTAATPTQSPSRFSCDGRTMCTQMTSCAEATYFIEYCPNTKMDGNRDGVPCEQQWCRSQE